MRPPRTWTVAPPENLPDGDPNAGDPAEEWTEEDGPDEGSAKESDS